MIHSVFLCVVGDACFSQYSGEMISREPTDAGQLGSSSLSVTGEQSSVSGSKRTLDGIDANDNEDDDEDGVAA